MTVKPITSLIPSQIKQCGRFVANAADNALATTDIYKEGLQKLSVADQFADEEVLSEYGYPSGYTPKSVADQMVVLRATIPRLKSFDLTGTARHPLLHDAEGVFLIPLWEKIAYTYDKAVEIVLEKLFELHRGRFRNYYDAQRDSDRLHQTAKKVKFFQKLREEQKGRDILLVNAQFALRHRGRSVRRARAMMGDNEVGLGAFEVAVMLLTHPERFQRWDNLWIDAAGDEYVPESGADGVSACAPCFDFDDGILRFCPSGVGDPCGRSGSASAFVAPVVQPSE